MTLPCAKEYWACHSNPLGVCLWICGVDRLQEGRQAWPEHPARFLAMGKYYRAERHLFPPWSCLPCVSLRLSLAGISGKSFTLVARVPWFWKTNHQACHFVSQGGRYRHLQSFRSFLNGSLCVSGGSEISSTWTPLGGTEENFSQGLSVGRCARDPDTWGLLGPLHHIQVARPPPVQFRLHKSHCPWGI